MNKKIKCSIAVPFQQHSYRAAKAFIENKKLVKYYTTIYNNNSYIYKIIIKIMNNNIAERTKRRRLNNLDTYVYKYNEMLGLFYIFFSKFKYLKKMNYFLRKIMLTLFGKKVANDILKEKDIDVLLTYDTMSYSCYRRLNNAKKKYNVIKILDMSSTTANKIYEIILKESTNEFNNTLKRHFKLYNKKMLGKYREEIELADYFLVPSNFVRNSLLELGIKEENIYYLAHGVDTKIFEVNNNKVVNNNKLKFLFVGRVEAAKGIKYLFEVFNRVKYLNVELYVVGDILISDFQKKKCSSNIKFLGMKRREEMPKIYSTCDIFILSSLWEGSSLSLLEALASGLPVIASKYSCAPEIITEYKEGFVIEPRDINLVVKKIEWFIKNPEKIELMSKNARLLAEKYSWKSYRKNLNKIIEEVFKTKKGE